MPSSPRGAQPRKPGKSIKEKRAIKKQKKSGGDGTANSVFGR